MNYIGKLLKQMTLREKLAQLTQLDSSFFLKYGTSDLTGPLHSMKILEEDVAACGSVLGAIGAEVTTEIQKRHLEADRNKIPLMFMLDVIHGFRTIFPINLAMGCSWEPERVEEAMRISSVEAAASGIHVNFAPMADLVRDSRWGRVMESTGEDPYLSSLFAAAAVRGIQGKDVSAGDSLASCIKHIAGYGAAEAGRDYNTTEIGLNTLFEFYMPAYRAAVDSGVSVAMSAFNVLNGIPGTANHWLLNEVLRKLWGFDGPVISDWGAVSELICHGAAENGADAAQLALNAGVDIEMMTSDYLQFTEKLIAEGKITEKQIDDAVLRVLKLKEKLGLFENPYHGASTEKEKELHCCEAHRAAAYGLAVRSIVLLKNDGILPLVSGKKCAVIGPYCCSGDLIGGWGCIGRIEDTVTLKDAFGEDGFTYCEGSGINEKNPEMFKNAINTAKNSEIIIMALGEHRDMSGEAASRTDISLPECQTELFQEITKLGKPVITVLFNGRPLLLKEISEKSSAVLEAWFPGTEGGRAVSDILLGKALPEGRLTMSFPYSVGQLPLYYNHFSTGRPMPEDGSAERYLSKYLDAPNSPLYPFGYGLGYSETEYTEFTVQAADNGVSAEVTLENIGKYDITETVQLYIHDVAASVARPIKQLKAFKKVFIPSGEAKTVKFSLFKDDLSFYTADGLLHYEPGKFEIMVGSDSAHLLKETVTVGDLI